jgi:hypothetical protein
VCCISAWEYIQASLLPYTLVAASSHAFSVDYRPLVLVLLALAAVAAVVAFCTQPFSVLDMFALAHIVVVLQPALVYELHGLVAYCPIGISTPAVHGGEAEHI